MSGGIFMSDKFDMSGGFFMSDKFDMSDRCGMSDRFGISGGFACLVDLACLMGVPWVTG